MQPLFWLPLATLSGFLHSMFPLTHFDFQHFRRLAPQAASDPTPLPVQLLQSLDLQIFESRCLPTSIWALFPPLARLIRRVSIVSWCSVRLLVSCIRWVPAFPPPIPLSSSYQFIWHPPSPSRLSSAIWRWSVLFTSRWVSVTLLPPPLTWNGFFGL